MQMMSSLDWDRPEHGHKGTTPTGEFRVYDIFRPSEDAGLHAYFVRSYSDGATVGSHFHVIDQFQVFAEGNGSFQRRDVAPVTVHFTDPYSTYGPIVAGPGGLGFFVLRTEFDPGGNYMPGSRDLLRGHTPGRNLHGEVRADGDEVIARHDDGLLSAVVRAPEGEVMDVPPSNGTRGQYILSLGGDVEIDGRVVPRWTVAFVEPTEVPPEIVSRSSDSQLLVLQFPAQLAQAESGLEES
jgi:hypothetical protein